MAATDAPVAQIKLIFGNDYPQMQVKQDDGTQISVPAQHLNQSETVVEFAADVDDEETVALALTTDNDRMLAMIGRNLADADKKWAIALNELEQIVATHTGGMKPSWIASEDPDLQRVAAAHFNVPEGRPTALFTSVGRDALHAQHLSTAAQPAAFNYMGLTASVVAPASGDTTLTGEIATAGGGLIRKQCTYAHTVGTNTSTLTATFTANGSDSLPVTVAQGGIFNAITAGTLGYHTALNATATLTVSGDNVTNTWTGTIG